MNVSLVFSADPWLETLSTTYQKLQSATEGHSVEDIDANRDDPSTASFNAKVLSCSSYAISDSSLRIVSVFWLARGKCVVTKYKRSNKA